MQTHNIFEVLEYGPIVAHDKANGVLITVNDVCFSAWTYSDGLFVGGNTCLITQLERVGDCTDFRLVCEVAKEWMEELLEEVENIKPSND